LLVTYLDSTILILFISISFLAINIGDKMVVNLRPRHSFVNYPFD